MGNMEVGADNWYLPKTEVDYLLQNRLIRVQNLDRLGKTDNYQALYATK